MQGLVPPPMPHIGMHDLRSATAKQRSNHHALNRTGQQVNLETPQIKWWRENIKPTLSAALPVPPEIVRKPQSIRPRLCDTYTVADRSEPSESVIGWLCDGDEAELFKRTSMMKRRDMMGGVLSSVCLGKGSSSNSS